MVGFIVFLLLAASLFALIGLFMLSNATAGVGLLTAGCFLAIIARIAQASHHHKLPPDSGKGP